MQYEVGTGILLLFHDLCSFVLVEKNYVTFEDVPTPFKCKCTFCYFILPDCVLFCFYLTCALYQRLNFSVSFACLYMLIFGPD
jgi:hypothetical protein